VRTILVLAAVTAVGVGVGGCSAAPSAEEERAASVALAATRMTGQSLGRCLAAAGYDTELGSVAGNVERAPDVTLTTGSSKAYVVTLDGPTPVRVTVLYDKAWVSPTGDEDKAVLEKLGCDLP
jgi:hypothetical protein